MTAGKKKAILILIFLGAMLLAGRRLIYGVSFTLTLTGLACLALAAVVRLTGPFERPAARRLARALLRLTAALCALLLISFVWIEALIVGGEGGAPIDDADVLVVLGAGLRGVEPSPILTSRLQVTEAYMKAHPGCIAVLTGSQGGDEGTTEARAMADWLTARGIDAARLYLEEDAHNTAQNIKYSLALMAREGLDGRVMVVSSEFHLYRARRIFARSGLEVAALPAPTPRVGITRLNSYLREYCSVVVMQLKTAAGIDE